MSDDEQWLRGSEAQSYIGRTDRQLRRYAQSGRVRTRTRSGRVEYHRGDLDDLRGELREDTRPRAPDQQVMPAGELLQHITGLERQLGEAMAQIGYLRGVLEERNLQIEEAKAVRALLADKEQEARTIQDHLREARGNARRGWTLAIIVTVLLIIAIIWYFFIR